MCNGQGASVHGLVVVGVVAVLLGGFVALVVDSEVVVVAELVDDVLEVDVVRVVLIVLVVTVVTEVLVVAVVVVADVVVTVVPVVS